MKLEQAHWTEESGWQRVLHAPDMSAAQLLLVFGAPEALARPAVTGELAAMYPGARLLGCSTSGEISGARVYDDSVVATALHLERTTLRTARIDVDAVADSREAGRRLAAMLSADRLVHVLVLSDGLRVNGAALVDGLEQSLPRGVTITGGLAGDAARFANTLVCLDGETKSGTIAAVGFYGAGLRVGCGSLGGFDPFGPDRLVTRSEGTVVHELDGEPALALYKSYLGEHAADLPSSGLHFPLSVRTLTGESVVRTVLGVNEAEGSITLAGDVPEGSYARLMRANYDRLIEGASRAAESSREGLGQSPAELAILVSCVGRKLVLGQRTEEEVESVRDIVGDRAVLTGFYSYGEISPFTAAARCQLHNQTMTVTTLSEN